MGYCSHVEHSHVKINLVHQLYRVQAVGSLPIENFKNLLTPDQHEKCITKTIATWNSLTCDLFLDYLYNVNFIQLFVSFHTNVYFMEIFRIFVFD